MEILRKINSRVTKTGIILTIIMLSMTFAGAISVNKISAFTQDYTITINKTDKPLGEYTINTRDATTGIGFEHDYIDNTLSDVVTQSRHLSGVSDGDSIQVCVEQTSTSARACDTKTADSSNSISFLIDMSTVT